MNIQRIRSKTQDQVYSNMNPIDKIAYFHKILSDPKRIEMITLLSKKAYYGQELVQSMNLATSNLNLNNNWSNLVFYMISIKEINSEIKRRAHWML